MIDERHEELAALYAFDLLEGAERDQFAAAVAADPALAKLVAELREASAALAHSAPAAAPPAALKARVLASAGQSKNAPAGSNVIRPPVSLFRAMFPWAAAAGFALVAAVLGQRYFAEQSTAAQLRDQVAVTEVALQSARNETEAAQILTRRQLDTLNQQLAESAQQLTLAKERATSTEDRLASVARQLADATARLSDATRQIAGLNGRLEASTRSTTESQRRERELTQGLEAAKTQVATLERQLKTEGDLANLKITALASMLKNSPQAIAVAVWNPAKQEGVLKVDKLPPLASDKSYQLWVVDSRDPNNPVDGGVFGVDPQTGAQSVKFTGKQPVGAIAAFAVTLERKGGVKKAEGPFVLLGK